MVPHFRNIINFKSALQEGSKGPVSLADLKDLGGGGWSGLGADVKKYLHKNSSVNMIHNNKGDTKC